MRPGDAVLVVIMALYFVVVLPVDVAFLRRAGARIRERHPAAWAALRVSSVHSIAFARFVRTKGYLRLNDPDLTALFTRKRRFDMLTGIAFVAAVGVVVFMQRAPK
jgi:hypothetical protein